MFDKWTCWYVDKPNEIHFGTILYSFILQYQGQLLFFLICCTNQHDCNSHHPCKQVIMNQNQYQPKFGNTELVLVQFWPIIAWFIVMIWLHNTHIKYSMWGYGAERWIPQIARLMGPTWGTPGADRTQVGPMLAPWTLLSRTLCTHMHVVVTTQLCRQFSNIIMISNRKAEYIFQKQWQKYNCKKLAWHIYITRHGITMTCQM